MALAACAGALRAYPFAGGVSITTAKTVAADLLVQLAVEQREWDARRSALFALCFAFLAHFFHAISHSFRCPSLAALTYGQRR